MAWRQPGDKPLSEPVMVRSLPHICVARPQWVKHNFRHAVFKHMLMTENLTISCEAVLKWMSLMSTLVQVMAWSLTLGATRYQAITRTNVNQILHTIWTKVYSLIGFNIVFHSERSFTTTPNHVDTSLDRAQWVKCRSLMSKAAILWYLRCIKNFRVNVN